jgi:hypothetical protein
MFKQERKPSISSARSRGEVFELFFTHGHRIKEQEVNK